MDIVVCPHCDGQVIGRADGSCPACQESLTSAPRDRPAAPIVAPPAAKGPGISQMIAPLLGVVVAAVFLNLSRDGGVDSMTLVSVGGALVGGLLGLLLVSVILRALRARK